jgi:hypothetical protein
MGLKMIKYEQNLKHIHYNLSESHAMLVLKNAVFWDVVLFRSFWRKVSTLKMEAIRSSETSVHTISTHSHIPEDGILRSHHYENLKSSTMLVFPA